MIGHPADLERILAWQASVLRDAARLSFRERSMKWRDEDDTGLSSLAVWNTMTGRPCEPHHPHDPGDLGRIVRLLELIPEWRSRMPEMASLSPEWSALVGRWEEITAVLASETGFFGEWGNRAPRTYRLMRETLDNARKTT